MINIQQLLQDQIAKDLAKKFDNLIIEGLKKKGHEFETQEELEEFIKTRCRCEDTPSKKEKVYYVDDQPFFMYIYDTQPTFIPPNLQEEEYKINVDFGAYKYL